MQAPSNLTSSSICLYLQQLLMCIQQTEFLHKPISWSGRVMPPPCCHFSRFHTLRLHLNMALFLHQIITVHRDCKQPCPGFSHCCIFSLVMTNLVFLYSDTTRIPLYSSLLPALAASPIFPPVPAPTPDQRLLIFIFSILGKLRHKKSASISAHSMKARLCFFRPVFSYHLLVSFCRFQSVLI